MTQLELLKFTDKYAEVRGWRARRLYIARSEWIKLRTDDRTCFINSDPAEQFMFDGALVTLVRSVTVAALIRQWDIQP